MMVETKKLSKLISGNLYALEASGNKTPLAFLCLSSYCYLILRNILRRFMVNLSAEFNLFLFLICDCEEGNEGCLKLLLEFTYLNTGKQTGQIEMDMKFMGAN